MVNNFSDIDRLLQKDGVPRQQLLARASDLMTAARYDGAKYSAWALKGL
jgi:hypothetical protein